MVASESPTETGDMMADISDQTWDLISPMAVGLKPIHLLTICIRKVAVDEDEPTEENTRHERQKGKR